MSVYLLFHLHDDGRHPMTYITGDLWCSLFGFLPYIIEDGLASAPSLRSGIARANSLAEALADPILKDYTWVWLDPQGDKHLHEYHHPVDNVVYVLGHDVGGFGDVQVKGDRIKAIFPKNNELHASLILPLLCYDRYSCINGGR